VSTASRSLTITEELVRAYSRRGNYHSDASTSSALGLPGLVAQGMQAFGPAYGLLLDAWGEDFLAHGEIEMRFVGLVLAGDTVDASITIDGDAASFDVRNRDRDAIAVAGHAVRTRTSTNPES
jgi:acyl dehydratase